MDKNKNEQLTAYITDAPEEKREIMENIRGLIHQYVENEIEEFKWNKPVLRTTKDFAYLQANKNNITLGFTKNNDKIQDPNNLLEGTEKTMRHIKIKNTSDIDGELLGEWIKTVTIK